MSTMKAFTPAFSLHGIDASRTKSYVPAARGIAMEGKAGESEVGMKLRLAALVSVVVCAAAFSAAARADTHAPSAQHVTMICDSGTYDAVSPADAAHGGQVTTSNATIVALNTTVKDAVTGDILFQSRPTAVRNPQAQTCWFAIDGVIVTIGAIVTPRA